MVEEPRRESFLLLRFDQVADAEAGVEEGPDDELLGRPRRR